MTEQEERLNRKDAMRLALEKRGLEKCDTVPLADIINDAETIYQWIVKGGSQ